jgi:hypothetical protein
MTVQYFAKVVDMQHVSVAIANNEAEAKALRQQQFEPCSRAFYDSVIRSQNGTPSNTVK